MTRIANFMRKISRVVTLLAMTALPVLRLKTGDAGTFPYRPSLRATRRGRRRASGERGAWQSDERLPALARSLCMGKHT